VRHQAAILAFADVFWMLALIFALLLPFVLLLRGRSGNSGEVEGKDRRGAEPLRSEGEEER